MKYQKSVATPEQTKERSSGRKSPNYRKHKKAFREYYDFDLRLFSGPSPDVLARIEGPKTANVSQSVQNHRKTSPTTITDVPKFEYDENDFPLLGSGSKKPVSQLTTV